MTTYRLFPSTNGPTTANGFSGNFLQGMSFCVTEGGCWFEGYWWWVCPTGGLTAPQKFALWSLTGSGTGILVPGSVVTSGTMTTGWNYIPLATPLNLSPGTNGEWAGSAASAGCAPYLAATATNGAWPDTANSFGSGQTYASGIVNGPLMGYSDTTTNGMPYNMSQGVYSTSGSDPSVTMPNNDPGNHDNMWIDVQISDTAPSGYAGSYRGFPNYPSPAGSCNADTGTVVSANEFWLSEPCALSKLWFFSPAGATHLPARCGIWSITSQTEVSGTDNGSPSWSGAAASGWVSVSYSGVTLPAGKYRAAIWNNTASAYYQDIEGYFGTDEAGNPGPGAANIVNGPLTFPTRANASNANWDDSSGSKPAQGVYQNGAWAYPNAYETKAGWANGTVEQRGIDVEVIPAATGSGLLMATFP